VGRRHRACGSRCLYQVLLVRFPCWLLQRGFLWTASIKFFPGVSVAVVVWRFWRGKLDADLARNGATQLVEPDSPTPYSQPNPGRAASDWSRRSGDTSGAVFLFVGQNLSQIRRAATAATKGISTTEARTPRKSKSKARPRARRWRRLRIGRLALWGRHFFSPVTNLLCGETNALL